MNSSADPYALEENLAMRPGVRVRVSIPNPTGRGARDPHVLLNETAYRLDGQPLSVFLQNRARCYDTYDGYNKADGPDWYAVEFPETTTFNCVDMTMEAPHRDGGWWTSLAIEVRYTADGPWLPVEQFEIVPPYCFADTPVGRSPYATHALTFNEVSARAVRVIGQPGGVAQFTALARLAIYRRDLSRWNPSSLPQQAIPCVFRLISAQTIWDLSESLVKLTGLAIGLPLMDYYLDPDRYGQWWRRISRNYQGEPDLWFLLGESLGWAVWSRLEHSEYEAYSTTPSGPYVRLGFHNTLARAVAPIVVENQVQGEMTSHPVVLKDTFDEAWHQRYAAEHNIPWSIYQAALQRSAHMTMEQLEGAAALMGMVSNTIANLAYRKLILEQELNGARHAMKGREQERREIVQNAIRFMQENLEKPIHVTDVARAVALSPTYFGILFQEQMGRKPSDYLIALRIERAKEYLAHTEMSITNVCVALGYSPSHFSHIFKRHTGLTPGQYAHRLRSRHSP